MLIKDYLEQFKKVNFVFYLIGSTKRAIPIIPGSLNVSTKFYHNFVVTYS